MARTGQGEGGEGCLDIEARLREAIHRLLRDHRRVSLRLVARAMAVGTRSIQRHLQASGTSYARVLKDERARLVTELAQGGMPAELVADALGYKSTRSIDRIRARETSRCYTCSSN